jgi:hypothetical protein
MMPVILRTDGLKCFFYANQGNPREPATSMFGVQA